jgi:hypothetical protein
MLDESRHPCARHVLNPQIGRVRAGSSRARAVICTAKRNYLSWSGLRVHSTGKLPFDLNSCAMTVTDLHRPPVSLGDNGSNGRGVDGRAKSFLGRHFGESSLMMPALILVCDRA